MPNAMTEMEDLLEKTRIVGRALQNASDSKQPDYHRLARLISDTASANALIVGRDGAIIGHGALPSYDCPVMKDLIDRGVIPQTYVDKLNMLRETETEQGADCPLADRECGLGDRHSVRAPILGTAERLGTLILTRFGEEFTTKDLVLTEYLSTVVGLEILYERGRSIEERGRERLVVQMAMRALSFSEIESIKHIVEDLDGPGGVVVASKIADRAGVTRSVIVNALRKLGSAGIIESRSLGMKGTYIRIVSSLFLDELGIKQKSSN